MFHLSPTLWIAIGGALLIATLSGTVWVQTARLDTCHAKAETDKLMIQGLGDQIASQNEAVAAAGEATKAAKAKGVAATVRAQKEAAGLAGEVGRLSVLLKQAPSDTRTCHEGVADARKGLAQ